MLLAPLPMALQLGCRYASCCVCVESICMRPCRSSQTTKCWPRPTHKRDTAVLASPSAAQTPPNWPTLTMPYATAISRVGSATVSKWSATGSSRLQDLSQQLNSTRLHPMTELGSMLGALPAGLPCGLNTF
jgi:hypothetical protein